MDWLTLLIWSFLEATMVIPQQDMECPSIGVIKLLHLYSEL